jgi:hypothetical protein
MPTVLVVSSSDLTPVLGRTVLWRHDVERVFAPQLESAFDVARRLLPSLVVVNGCEPETLSLLERLRQAPATRRASVAVVARTLDFGDEDTLRRAGANLVLVGEVDPSLWDTRLEELLTVPRRKDVRIPVRFEVWSRVEPNAAPVEAMALNISVRGLLLETDELLDMGTRLDLAFTMPGQDEEQRAVGQVVREAASEESLRYGVELLILRGSARQRIVEFIESEREQEQ